MTSYFLHSSRFFQLPVVSRTQIILLGKGLGHGLLQQHVPSNIGLFFTESLCPVSLRTASTPSPPHRWTKRAAKSCRSTWWQVRARWGRCEGTTCWCTGSTSGTDTCEQLQTDKSLTQWPKSSFLVAATARNISFLLCLNLFQCKITSTDGILI